ncbi:MAG: hypothetical protein JNK30_21665 [Phenylobacterium sp.]|uniref:hypothetical protein n=1 Tax=Phenylobacterium sp. TaxID=1871053 RepID=UPI001A579900|nr:hypothetical protein [Phenylobacterium sp.]MBL8774009.1 hypothetical protein [Phenylobacterium sp.]
MSKVKLRPVRYRLRDMVGGTRGVRVSEALARAEANLEQTAGVRWAALDEGLQELVRMIGHGRAERPGDDELKHVRRTASSIIACCMEQPLPSVARVLAKLCEMTDSLLASRYWVAGALDPAIELALLCRRGEVPEAHVGPLLDALDACIARYRAEEEDVTA